MATLAINQIERQFAHLPPEEQLRLLEQLVEQFRVGVTGNRGIQENSLEALAANAEIQRALDRLGAESRAAESDLLNEVW